MLSNTWSVSGNRGVIAVAVGQGVYGRMCVLKRETGPSCLCCYDNILFVVLISQTHDCLPVLPQRLWGKQKPLENNKISFKTPLCDTLCATL